MTDKTPTARRAGKQIDKTVRTLDRAAARMRKDASLSKSAALREVGISEAREIKRLVAMLPPARKATAAGKAARPKSAPATAMPLRASAPKKVGAVNRTTPAKPSPHASYQPKASAATTTKNSPAHAAAAASTVPDFFAMTQPWMRLGMQMAFTGLTLPMRLANAAIAMSPSPTKLDSAAALGTGPKSKSREPAPRRAKD